MACNHFQYNERGFTLVELTVAVLIVALIAGLGYVTAERFVKGSERTKLQGDLNTLNSAVKVYLAQGGRLDVGTNDPNAVLGFLRTEVAADDAEAHVGLKGALVDSRLRAIMLTEAEQESSRNRVVWSPSERRFKMVNSGPGVKEFALVGDVSTTELVRDTSVQYARESNWIWDYSDAPLPARGSMVQPSTSPGMSPTAPAASLSVGTLSPPALSISGGTYDYSLFPLSVTITDTNTAGTARILYQIDDGEWQVYSGAGVVILPTAQTRLAAFCQSASPDLWLDSTTAVETYGTVTFSGDSGGEFVNPVGGVDMEASSTVVDGEAQFQWGEAATSLGYPRPSELKFRGAEFSSIILEQEFVLGTLDYYNGTIWAGTGADAVDLDVVLDFTVVPGTQISFQLELINTVNDFENNTNDENADYVKLTAPVQTLSTTIGGATYYVHLSFGDSGPGSYTTDSTFHVWEGAEATGTILAKLSSTPPGEEDMLRPTAILTAASTKFGGHFNVGLSFDEYVSDLTAAELVVSNGSVTALNGDGYHFVVGINPVTDGTVSISLPADAAFDLAGNGNQASNQLEVVADLTQPTGLLIAPEASNANFMVEAVFNEPVVGFDATDIEITNGIVDSVVTVTPVSYEVAVIPGVIGSVVLSIRSGAVTDEVGHSIGSSPPVTIDFDPDPPVVTLSTSGGGGETVNGMFSVQVDVSEAVTDLQLTDFLITNGTAYTIVEHSASSYTLSVLPHHIGSVDVQLAELTVSDAAGNGNAASNTVTVDYDPPGPQEFIDFNQHTISSWGSIFLVLVTVEQDEGTATVAAGGSELRLSTGAWKSIDFAYEITPSTVIEFEFKPTGQGEVHGIGFDDDEYLSLERIFQVYGTQEHGIQDYHNYTGSGWRSYSIPVGQFYTGSFDRMFFVMDQDEAGGTAESLFKNVRVYEQ